MKKLVFASLSLIAGLAFADADVLYRSPGIRIGQRMTLRPYVNMSYTFDSNTDSERDDGRHVSYWTANPGFDFDYNGGNWRISGLAYYQYHASLSGRQTSLNNSSYGEQLGFHWSNIENGGAGWSAMISERFSVINQNDDFSNGDGKGLWRDRQQFDVSAMFQRRFNEHWHASANGSYYWLDYANDDEKYAPLYGWNRWTAGLQLGCTLSKWTDVFVAGNYQGYLQDNVDNATVGRMSNDSQGYTLHLGVGSYMTERISYRLSGGWSRFEYADSATSDGFTYQGNLRWRFGETWSTTLLLASYYQPSEREYGSAVRCDSISWGLAKSLVRGKVNATFDVAYRRDTNVYSSDSSNEWDLNLLTARLGVNYNINRILSVFARGEFQTELNGGEQISRHYDYERWRCTVGLRFAY